MGLFFHRVGGGWSQPVVMPSPESQRVLIAPSPGNLPNLCQHCGSKKSLSIATITVQYWGYDGSKIESTD